MQDNKRPTENDVNSSSSGEKKRTKTFYIRLTIIYAVCILLLLLVVNYDSFAATINKFTSVLMPLLYGAVIAYLCNPLYNLFFDRCLARLKSIRWRKILSLVLTYVVVIILIFAMLFILIQQLIVSVQNFLANIETYIKNAEAFIFDIIDNLDFIKSENELGGEPTVPEITGPGTENDTVIPSDTDDLGNSVIDPNEQVQIFDFAFTKESLVKLISGFFDDYKAIISNVGNAIVQSGTTAAVTVFNVFLGFIFSIYILTEKDMICAKAKKLTMSCFRPDRAKRYIALCNYSNGKIGHFIKGKIVESVIVGILAYIAFIIFGIPAPLMIAMIVAIMNMIPVFGPFLGAIPAALLVLIMDPSKTIVYIIIVIIIMQINGNYISPRIVGNSTGLTPLGAMTALILMSGYFGVIGMFIGIPISAIVTELLWREMNSRLEERGLSDNLDDYYSEKALAVLNEERAHPSHGRNLTAIVVDEAVLLFNLVFRRRKNSKKSTASKAKKEDSNTKK
ncbi:MAG: AI-2E family transporter [Clostridia bacterium]|nr:AI-2E family transporter [Clostridia bacterium]